MDLRRSVEVTGDDRTKRPGSARNSHRHAEFAGSTCRPGISKVALVADDLVSTQPWTASCLRMYGTAELVERQGQFGPAPYMRITPTISWS